MNARVTGFPPVKPGAGSGEDGARNAQALAALVRLVQLAPHVFPAVMVADDWTAALDQARQVVNPRSSRGQAPKMKGMGE